MKTTKVYDWKIYERLSSRVLCKQFLLSIVYRNAISWKTRLWSNMIGQVTPTLVQDYGSPLLIRRSRCYDDDGPDVYKRQSPHLANISFTGDSPS